MLRQCAPVLWGATPLFCASRRFLGTSAASPRVRTEVRLVRDSPLPGSCACTPATATATVDEEDRRAWLSPRGRHKMYNLTALAAWALIPPAIVLAPAQLTDAVLALAIPAHFNVGLRRVVGDYAYGTPRLVLNRAINCLSFAALVSALNLCVHKGGIGAAFRALWSLE
uniref:Mitochondrial succinate dehydrogenase D n=1 Tax=Mastigamoeba balamuthi TaxID=108607 RepID=A0A0B5D4E1_MASBA|nr:mitochondrial succinate dehydrogenase D [Mastigamoeba balamuthi]